MIQEWSLSVTSALKIASDFDNSLYMQGQFSLPLSHYFFFPFFVKAL